MKVAKFMGEGGLSLGDLVNGGQPGVVVSRVGGSSKGLMAAK